MQQLQNEMTGVNNINNIHIKSLYLVPTKEVYKDPYIRSYTLNANNQDLDNLETLFNQAGVGNHNRIDEMTIARNIPNIMSLSGTVTGKTGIAYGWGTQRLRFIMVVESTSNGMDIVSYVQGYSEYHDPSFSGKIDPNMKFFINSITNITRIMDPQTGYPIIRPDSTFNLITDAFGNESYTNTTEQQADLKLIRPLDVVDEMYNTEMYGNNDSIATINYAGNYSGNTSISDRMNANPLNHFTKTVNSFITARSMAAMSHDTNDILKTASNALTETNILATPFIAALYNLTGIPSPTTFNLNLLQSLSPDLPTNTFVAEQNTDIPVATNTILDSAYTEDLYKNNIETIMATTIAQSVSGMLIENLLSVIDFSVTNITGTPVIALSYAQSFIEGLDSTSYITSYINKVLARIEYVLFPEISSSNQLLLEIFVHVHVLGDANVSISVNNQPHVLYRFPAFADSLYNPVISNSDNKALMANDFANIIDRTYTGPQQVQY